MTVQPSSGAETSPLTKKKFSTTSDKTCIFCGGTPVTAEHLWPQWMHDRLRLPDEINHHTKLSYRDGPSTGPRPQMREKKRAGPLRSTSPRIVCGPVCNNGWMSVNESRAQDCIERLAWGAKADVSVDEQAALATWLAMKSVLFEYADDEGPFTSKEQRTRFLNSMPPPTDGWIIQIARYKGKTLHDYARHVFSERGEPRLQQTSFWIGSLFASISCGGLEDIEWLSRDERLATIWPPSSQVVQWGERRHLRDEDAVIVSRHAATKLALRKGILDYLDSRDA